MKTPTSYTSGDAGCGKTHKYRELIKTNPKWGLLTATTGIGAVTINGQTIHSLMSYSDLDDMRRVVRNGGFFGRLKRLFNEGELWPGCTVVIDEHSMLNAEQLDTTLSAFDSLNNWIEAGGARDSMQYGGGDCGSRLVSCGRCEGRGEVEREEGGPRACPACGGNGDIEVSDKEEGAPVGLALVGDFAQLPPVEGRFAFHAESWPRFEANHEHLTTQYRQSDPSFLNALNLMRKGQGAQAVEELSKTAVEFSMFGDSDYDGVTIYGTNKDVTQCNEWKYSQLKGEEFVTSPVRKGEQKKDWLKEDIVPKELKMKIGARVMVLANDAKSGYSNGDMGTLLSIVKDRGAIVGFTIELDRLKGKPSTECLTCFGKKRVLDRGGMPQRPSDLPRVLDLELEDAAVVDLKKSATFEAPMKDCPRCKGTGIEAPITTINVTRTLREQIDPKYNGPRWKAREDGAVIGSVSYFPIKLAYGLTVHKVQGLSLSKVQFNIGHPFTGAPAMCYVAISRVKTPEGLRIVGSKDMLAGRIQAHPEVARFL